jgi:hypothetical protein
MTEIMRQGDLLFRKITKIPSGVYPSKTNILLRGESTGHAHKLENGQIFNTFSFRNPSRTSGVFYIEARKSARVVHEEHGMLELEVGFYMCIRQREFLTLDEQRPDWSFIKD